jgi:hypothetical protein
MRAHTHARLHASRPMPLPRWEVEGGGEDPTGAPRCSQFDRPARRRAAPSQHQQPISAARIQSTHRFVPMNEFGVNTAACMYKRLSHGRFGDGRRRVDAAKEDRSPSRGKGNHSSGCDGKNASERRPRPIADHQGAEHKDEWRNRQFPASSSGGGGGLRRLHRGEAKPRDVVRAQYPQPQSAAVRMRYILDDL